jgi:5'-methylthioinosine phosphorylase
LPSPIYESVLDAGSARIAKFETPFGAHALTFGTVEGVQVVVAQQFGGDPPLSSAAFNMQAEAAAVKMTGARRVVAFNAYGYLCDENGDPAQVSGRPLDMLDVVVPDDVDTLVTNRPTSVFSPLDIRVDLGITFCPGLREALVECVAPIIEPHSVVDGGTVAVFDGPYFPTPGMIRRARLGGAHLGSTTLYPRVVFYREIEVCFAQLAYTMNPIGAPVALRIARLDAAVIERLLRAVVAGVTGRDWGCACQRALDGYRDRVPEWYAQASRGAAATA